jgi:hypothetical protein
MEGASSYGWVISNPSNAMLLHVSSRFKAAGFICWGSIGIRYKARSGSQLRYIVVNPVAGEINSAKVADFQVGLGGCEGRETGYLGVSLMTRDTEYTSDSDISESQYPRFPRLVNR